VADRDRERVSGVRRRRRRLQPEDRLRHLLHLLLLRPAVAADGLWTSKTNEGGELVESCTIVTTSPNELAAPVHDRMSVILPVELEQDWLDQEISKEHALSCFTVSG
jgi:hypothetical protein